MILTTLRSQMRGWLQDVSSIQWTDQQIDRYINLGLRETQKHVLTIEPEAFKCTYTRSTVIPDTGADALYSFPAGTVAIHEIAISSNGTTYVPLQRLPLSAIRASSRGDIGTITRGGWVPFSASKFILWPSPSSVVTRGLRIIVAPTLAMAEDNDKNPLPVQFETLHLRQSQLFALWDVGEPTETLQKEIQRLKEDNPRYLLSQIGAEPPLIQPVGFDRY